VNTSVPVVSGTPVSGSTLAVTPGIWSPPGTAYTYRWQRDFGAGFNDIPGAAAATYRLGVGDKDALLRVVVVARKGDGSAAAYSDDFGPISVPAPVNTRLPTIIGAAKTGVVLTATTGTWSPAAAGYAMQWQRDTGSGFVDVPGARSSTLRLGLPDRQAKLRVKVSGVSGATVVDAYSADLGPVLPQPPLDVVLPRVSGSTLIGATLTGTTGNWNPSGTSYAFQWQRDDGTGYAAVGGATRSTYKLSAADKDAKLRLQILATNADGQLKAWSAAIGPIRAPAAAATLRAGATSSLRSASGTVLASATAGGGAAHASRVSELRIKVRRSAAVRGKLRVLACGSTCTPLRALGTRTLTLKVPAPSGRVRIMMSR
jgi:hypothetical protein